MGSSNTLINEISSAKPVVTALAPERSRRAQNQAGASFPAAVKFPACPLAITVYLLLCLVALCSAFRLPSIEDRWCFNILKDKHRILDHAASSPKLIFVGGSNLLFGLDGPRIERALGLRVVNMGLCMCFPLPYMFEEIKSQLHPGDIVVLSPEQPLLTDQHLRALILDDVLDTYPEAIQWMLSSDCGTYEQKALLVNHLFKMGFYKITYALEHLGPILKHNCRWRQGTVNPASRWICPSQLDSCGDLLGHLKMYPQCRFDPATEFPVAAHLDDETTRAINGFEDYCGPRGIKLVLIPPPVPQTQFVKAHKQIDNLMAECQNRLSVPFLASQQRYVFPDWMVFNCNFHLNKAGRQIRSDKVIEDLRPLLGTTQVLRDAYRP